MIDSINDRIELERIAENEVHWIDSLEDQEVLLLLFQSYQYYLIESISPGNATESGE